VSLVEIRSASIVDNPGLRAILDPTELERADRKPDPLPFIGAHAFLRTVVGERLGVEPTTLRFERHCTTCGTDQHGKPCIAGHEDLHISLSYTERLAVLALSEDGEVGVDVEDVTEADFDGFDAVTLAPEEVAAIERYDGDELLAARALLWARKEAVLKATGDGLVVDPTEVVVSGPGDPPALLGWRSQRAAPDPIAMADVPLAQADHRAAVAVMASGEVRLRA
jgi:4'-phosphopantetheinyl transferase